MVTYHFYCFFFRDNAWWRTFRESFKKINRELFFLRNHLIVNNQSAKRRARPLYNDCIRAWQNQKVQKMAAAPQVLANNQYLVISDNTFNCSPKQSSCRNHTILVLGREKNSILCKFQLQQNFSFNNKYLIPGTNRCTSSFMIIYVFTFSGHE